MGSRAVALVCRDASVAAARFGAPGGATGAVYTRTGRPFFNPTLTAQLLERLRAAVETSGLWNELETDWILLDAELLPWSAKAEELLRTQYAAVGAAARSALPVAVDALQQAFGHGVDVGDLLKRTRSRLRNADAFTDAYRRYCWATEGLDGVRIAPFQLLATDGKTYHDRDHLWHLSSACAVGGWGSRAGHRDATHRCRHHRRGRRTAATAWWEEMTAAGGEGMVVKPLANLTRGARGLVQPGLKVRGREYLRIIYGPDYTEPGNLERLRPRNLGHKRSLAAREYALGLESLERAARNEPLWRVHEAVFAVLALESEPVDPRL